MYQRYVVGCIDIMETMQWSLYSEVQILYMYASRSTYVQSMCKHIIMGVSK